MTRLIWHWARRPRLRFAPLSDWCPAPGDPDTRLLSSLLSASATVQASLSVGKVFAGSLAASAGAAGALAVEKLLGGTVLASGGFSAALLVEGAVSGSVTAAGAFAGGLTVERLLAGAVAAQGAGTGALTLERSLAGALAASMASVGALTVEVPATSLQPAEQGNTGLGSSSAGVTSGQAAQYTVHKIRGATSGLVLTFSGVEWSATGGEIALPSYAVRAAIEYPLGSGTFTNVTFGGAVLGTVNGGYLDSDAFPRVWADGDQFGLWVWGSGTRLPSRGTTGSSGVELYTDEAQTTGASISTTPSNAISDNFTRRRRMCMCVGIFGQKAADATSVAVVGDSMQAFTNSNAEANSATADHARGDLTRSIGQFYGTINLGLGGDQPSTYLVTNRTVMRMLARRATVIASGYGINEFNNRDMTGTQALAFRARWLRFWNGRRYVESTLTPLTSGTFADETGQTVNASRSPNVNIFNAAIRALPNFIERRTPVQGVNTDKFAAGASVDGLHESLSGVALVMATASAIKAAVDAAPVLNAAAPSAALTLTNTPTFSGGKFTRGTGTIEGTACANLPCSGECYLSATASSAIDITIGGAGRLRVNASGQLTHTVSGTQRAGTTVITDGVERHVAICFGGGTLNVYLNGVLEITASVSPGLIQQDKTFTATVGSGIGSLRQVSSWTGLTRTGAFTPPAPGYVTGSEPTLVAYWPLATDGSGVLGPVLP